MSRSSSSSSSSATQPLSNILPWGNPITVAVNSGRTASASSSSDTIPSPTTTASTTKVVVEDHRTLLVTDAPSTDGRFLLHTLALQFLSSRFTHCSPYRQHDHGSAATTTTTIAASTTAANANTVMEGAVLWITCAPVAERQIMMGLRKALQHDLGGMGGQVGTSGISRGSSTSSALGGREGFGNSSSNSSCCGPIHIISIPQELADAALSHHDESPFSHEMYLKGLHRRIVHWLQYRELIRSTEMKEQQWRQRKRDQDHHHHHAALGPHLIICDNVTTLGTLVGDKLANSFVSSVRSSMRNRSKRRSSIIITNSETSTSSSVAHDDAVITSANLFVIRASSPDDGGLYNLDENDTGPGEQKLRNEYSRFLRPWLGYGSGKSNRADGELSTINNITQLEEQCNYCSLSPDSVPSFLYSSGLYELADGIVDVSPLQSGYARDVLGRISFVPTWSGQGWWGTGRDGNASNKDNIDGTYVSLAVNYRCDDSGVRIMRLRSR